jgi:hypothetical protein
MGDIMKSLEEANKNSSSNNGNNFIGSDWLEVIQGNIQGCIEN